jgi:Family of unknown function (DUF6364)
MAKVTLYIDDEQVLERAKAYAKRQGVSLSKLVQQVLATLPIVVLSLAPGEMGHARQALGLPR